MQTRLKYWAGDHMGYLDALAALLKKCRLKCRAASKAVKEGTLSDETVVPMWKERGARVALILASQMVEMKVYIYFFILKKPALFLVFYTGTISSSKTPRTTRFPARGKPGP